MPTTTLTELHMNLWRFSPPEGKLIGANTSHDPHLHVWRQKRNSWWLYIHNFGRFNPPVLVALNPDFAARWSVFSNQIHICNCLYIFTYCFFSRIECRTILQEGNKQLVNLFVHFPPESTESCFAAYPHLASETVNHLLTIQIHFHGIISLATVNIW